jgi:hypothetical protein
MWYIASGALIIIILSIFLKNFLLAVIAIISAFTLALYSVKKPDRFKFEIGVKGIKINDKLLEYKEMDHFWINYDPPVRKEIVIKSKNFFAPHKKIPLDKTDPNLARKALKKFLKEEEIEPSIIDAFTDWMGI